MDPPKNPSFFHPKNSAAADLSLRLGLATPQYPQLNSLEFNGQWVADWLQIDRPQQSPAKSESSVNQPRETQLSSDTSSGISQFRKLLRKVTYNVESSDTQSISSPTRKAKEDVTTVPKFKRPRQSPEVETEAEGSSQRRLPVDSPLKALWEHFNIPNLPEEKLKKAFLLDAEFDYCDAEIIVEGTTVGVNRSILASRSPFFHELFKKTNVGSANESKPKYVMTELVPQGKIGYETFMVFLNYVYTGKLKPSPPEVSTCVDESCAHNACGPAINYAVELMYASATFQMTELVLAVQRRLFNFVDKAFVVDVIPIVVVAFQCHQNLLLSHCVQRMACSDLDDLTLEKELPREVLTDIKTFRELSNQDLEHNAAGLNLAYDKKIRRRIHRALDCDDVELMKLLLDESDITLDGAFALHYAAAYCNPKVVGEVLNLGNVDLNLRNTQGYTVLHVAARRKDPSVIMSLLSKGACVSDSTIDGQTSITICRRLTRRKDYNESTKQGEYSNNDRICIDVLERANAWKSNNWQFVCVNDGGRSFVNEPAAPRK